MTGELLSVELLSFAPYILTSLPDLKSRSKGMHAGQIIQDLGQSIGKIPRYTGKEEPGKKESYFDLGFTNEDVLLHQFQLENEWKRRQKLRSIARRLEIDPRDIKWTDQDEQVDDNIYMTPDLVWRFKRKVILLDEYKLTFTNPPLVPFDLLEAHWAWKRATQCYCRVLGVRKVRFIVCFVGGRVPITLEYIFDYEEDEIEEGWQQVREHRDLMARRKRVY